MLFDQRDLGLDGSGDVGRHQTGTAAANHQQITVEARWLLPVGVDLVATHHLQQLAGNQWKDAEQDKRAEQTGRQNAGQRIKPRQLGAGIDVHQRAGQHAELADPEIRPGFHRRQTEQQIDQEERKSRHQAQREEIEAAFAAHALVYRRQPLAKTRGHPVAQQKAGDQESERGADGRGEGDDQRAPEQPENCAARQRQQCGARKGEGGGDHVKHEINRHAEPGIARLKSLNRALLVFQALQIEDLPEIEDEERGDGEPDGQSQCQLAKLHEVLPVV